jgi:hypothetical protein
MKSKRVPTTIKIDPDLLWKAQVFAKENDSNLSNLIEETLAKFLNGKISMVRTSNQITFSGPSISIMRPKES